MIVKNISKENISIPGTQPGFSFRWLPGEELEVPDGLSGFILQNQNLKVIGVEVHPINPSDSITVNKDKVVPITNVASLGSVDDGINQNLEKNTEILQDSDMVKKDAEGFVDTETVQQSFRVITCDVCGELLKSRLERYDLQVISMHKGRKHKSNPPQMSA